MTDQNMTAQATDLLLQRHMIIMMISWYRYLGIALHSERHPTCSLIPTCSVTPTCSLVAVSKSLPCLPFLPSWLSLSTRCLSLFLLDVCVSLSAPSVSLSARCVCLSLLHLSLSLCFKCVCAAKGVSAAKGRGTISGGTGGVSEQRPHR